MDANDRTSPFVVWSESVVGHK